MEVSVQSRLLCFLHDDISGGIGGQGNLRPNARIACAASRNLEFEVQAGRFRKDLFYRINVGHGPTSLVAGDWLGNIRQRANVIRRYVIFDSEDCLLANVSEGDPAALTPASRVVFR